MGSKWQDFKKNIKTIDQETVAAIETLAELVSMRVQSGISQQDFAAKIGMKQPQLAKIEALDSIPTLQTLNRYARGLGYQITLSITKEKTLS